MTIIIQIIVFLLGMGICVQWVAALYGIIDLWYTFGTEYPKVIRRILIWSAVPAAIALLLGDPYITAFLLGFAAYVVFYPIAYSGLKLFTIRNRRLLEGGQSD
jgi:hypothetical protein